jgi:hypothetical protein
MKKYKVHFSLFNLFSDSQTEVVKLQTMWAGASAIITGSTWAMGTDSKALIVALLCGLVDKILACFYFEEKK